MTAGLACSPANRFSQRLQSGWQQDQPGNNDILSGNGCGEGKAGYAADFLDHCKPAGEHIGNASRVDEVGHSLASVPRHAGTKELTDLCRVSMNFRGDLS